MQAGVLNGNAELDGESREQRRLVGRERPLARRVDGQETDQRLGDEQRDDHGRLDPRGGSSLGDVDQARVEGGVLDRERVPRAEGPEGELEEALRHLQVRPGQAAGLRDREPILVVREIDREPFHVEQRGHAVDGRLECVAEREAGDRLAQDGEKRLRPLEVAGEPAGSLAQAQRVGGADPEARQLLQLELRRKPLRREPELERRERRSSERDRRQRVLQDDRARVRERAGGRLALDLSGLCAVAAERGQSLCIPERRGQCTGGLGGEPRNLVVRARLLEPGGERVPGEVERAEWSGCPVRQRGRGAEGTHDEGRLRRRKPRDVLVAGPEPTAGAVDLDAADRPGTREHRNDEARFGAQPRGRLVDGLRQGVRDVVTLQWVPRALELGRERLGGGRDRSGSQETVRIEHAHDHELGAGHTGRRLRDLAQRVVERVAAREPLARRCEGLEDRFGHVDTAIQLAHPHSRLIVRPGSTRFAGSARDGTD